MLCDPPLTILQCCIYVSPPEIYVTNRKAIP